MPFDAVRGLDAMRFCNATCALVHGGLATDADEAGQVPAGVVRGRCDAMRGDDAMPYDGVRGLDAMRFCDAILRCDAMGGILYATRRDAMRCEDTIG
jgi:hypothetical protein